MSFQDYPPFALKKIKNCIFQHMAMPVVSMRHNSYGMTKALEYDCCWWVKKKNSLQLVMEK